MLAAHPHTSLDIGHPGRGRAGLALEHGFELVHARVDEAQAGIVVGRLDGAGGYDHVLIGPEVVQKLLPDTCSRPVAQADVMWAQIVFRACTNIHPCC